jgi:hypothetical protein
VTIYIQGENGALLSYSAPLPPGILDRLNSGQLIQVNEDGSPFDGDYEDVDELPEDVPELPRPSDLRPVWEQYAMAQGLEEDEIKKLSKRQLIEKLSFRPSGDEDEDLASTE